MPEFRTPLPALFAATLESGLNGVLALDGAAAARLDRLEGKALRVVLEGTGIDLLIRVSGQRIAVAAEPPGSPAGEDESAVDTTVSGTPAALFSMAAAELGEGWSGPGSKVSISGDATLARDFERLFSRLDPDFEGALSGLFGDVVGHQLAFGLKQGARRLRETAGATGEVLGEVLREGKGGNRTGPLVGRDEARRFADDVDRLRDATERLEAKIRIRSAARGDTP